MCDGKALRTFGVSRTLVARPYQAWCGGISRRPGERPDVVTAVERENLSVATGARRGGTSGTHRAHADFILDALVGADRSNGNSYVAGSFLAVSMGRDLQCAHDYSRRVSDGHGPARES